MPSFFPFQKNLPSSDEKTLLPVGCLSQNGSQTLVVDEARHFHFLRLCPSLQGRHGKLRLKAQTPHLLGCVVLDFLQCCAPR